VLFPEGTRLPPGQLGRFQPGGAALAAATGAPILLVGHNAGRSWPAHALVKRPGEIQVLISEPLETKDKTTKELQQLATARFSELMSQLQGGS
jgi:1-acyl-sn-glycerol-3-phosphate acyltransferase